MRKTAKPLKYNNNARLSNFNGALSNLHGGHYGSTAAFPTPTPQLHPPRRAFPTSTPQNTAQRHSSKPQRPIPQPQQRELSGERKEGEEA
jgi:hypothetical protein